MDNINYIHKLSEELLAAVNAVKNTVQTSIIQQDTPALQVVPELDIIEANICKLVDMVKTDHDPVF
ncbi:MAG: hypothetical protein PHC60_07455 [Heliobacteriaceae bacterium]|nr:hypothetical protein [Heliobacteriaceae bacterium]MDD4588207.1 hypothetical protein [Heliobacteriaceae bacterium]